MVMGGGFVIGLLVLIFLLVLLAAAVGIGIWIYRQNTSDDGKSTRRMTGTAEEDPLEVLKRRYASGEISRDEFERIRDDIQR
ncbi:MAG: hypothetical protein GWN30_25290 [Gammaproteobacteria bacterium]|nr:hypothetical protein [Gammaproteobacteria bacterium]